MAKKAAGSPTHEDWVKAIVTAKTTVIRAGIEAGHDPNGFIDDELPLVKAIMYGGIKSVVALLEGGAKPNLPDEFGMTPLHYAGLKAEKPDVAEALVAAGGDPTIKSKKKHSLWAGANKGLTPIEMSKSRRFPKKKVVAYFESLA